MTNQKHTLLCWHSERAGFSVLEQTIKALLNRKIVIERVFYLVQSGRTRDFPQRIGKAEINFIELKLDDPTQHSEIYELVRGHVLPLIQDNLGVLHINISPGTPAMHSVWLILHAGGSLPLGAKLWSSQYNQQTKRTRIDPVSFPVSTYLSNIHRYAVTEPELAIYEPESQSRSRRLALENLARFSQVTGAPLLILGERGTGKTRLVETVVSTLKESKAVVTVTCGSLDSSLAEAMLFGHRKGAFTGADIERAGLLVEASGGILFLDEVQDLPKSVQRMLVRVFQDKKHRFRPVGSDREVTVDVELVCASNLPVDELRERLDADLFDRLSQLTVTVPPLRDCREDVKYDWAMVWKELRQRQDLPQEAPWSGEIQSAFQRHSFPGNLRDLQRLAVLIMAWWPEVQSKPRLRQIIEEWENWKVSEKADIIYLGQGSRTNRIHWFRSQLAQWAKSEFDTWKAAAVALECDEKTLRQDVGMEGDN